MRNHTDRGVLLGRADGVIVLADAIPWPTEVQRQLDDVLDALGARPHLQHQPQPNYDKDQNQ